MVHPAWILAPTWAVWLAASFPAADARLWWRRWRNQCKANRPPAVETVPEHWQTRRTVMEPPPHA